jgi:hypothetical protein
MRNGEHQILELVVKMGYLWSIDEWVSEIVFGKNMDGRMKR